MTSDSKSTYILCAGGTGGHINAAISIGKALSDQGHEVSYYSGQRELDYKLFSDFNCHHLKSSGIKGKNLKFIFQSLLNVVISFWDCLKQISESRPKAVVMTGGYVCAPVGLAAFFLGIPIYLLEQNSIAGLSNRALAPLATKIFVNFGEVKGLEWFKSKILITGNPVKNFESLIQVSQEISEEIKVLAIGGSLGATDICEFINVIASSQKKKMSICLQTGMQSYEKWKDKIEVTENCKLEVIPYIDNMPLKYQWANIIISRSGASSLSELSLIRKPCLLLPYPLAADNHQEINALEFAKTQKFYVNVFKNLDEVKKTDWSKFFDDFEFEENDSSGVEIENMIDPAHRIIQEI